MPGFDHNLSSVADEDLMTWDDATATIQGVARSTVAGAQDLPDLDDVEDTVSTSKGNLLVADGSLWDDLPVGTNGHVLTADSAQGLGVKWAAGGSGSSPLTTKGDLYTYDTGDARLPVGTNGQVLTADSGEATGIKWAAAGGGGGASVPLWIEELKAPTDSPDEAQEFAPGSPGGTLVEPTGTTTWTQARDVLSVNFHSQSTADVTGRMYPLSGTWQVGSYVETFMRHAGKLEAFNMAGLLLSNGTDATDTVVFAHDQIWNNAPGRPQMHIRSGTFTAIADFVLIDTDVHGPGIWMRLEESASDTWKLWCSPDGVSWTTYGMATLSRALDPTHYGVGVTRWNGGTEEAIATFDYLRVYDLA